MARKRLKIAIISDGTGETARGVVDAVMTQFSDCNTYFTRYKNVLTKEKIDFIFSQAAHLHDIVAYTIVQGELREYIGRVSQAKRIRTLDLLGPALTMIASYLGEEPSSRPGLFHAVNDDYFKRVEAMEFTLNHDDGRNLSSLHLADIILLGISRTSKTPLSLYLAQKKYKVVNIPMIKGIELPKELFKVDQRKIFALTIDEDELENIRKNRLSSLGRGGHGANFGGSYADKKAVSDELAWAEEIFAENKQWPLFNVTDKAVEETAAEIIKLINRRKK